MVLANTQLVVVPLLYLSLVGSLAETNVSLIAFPINITSIKNSLVDAFNNPLAQFRETLRDYAQKERNICVEEGGECAADTSSCCIVPYYDLECLPSGGTNIHICRLRNSEELAQRRIDTLQYGDSKGILNSHSWAESWEFQSKSQMEKEEVQAEEDLTWKKSLNLNKSDENVWTKTYKNIKIGGENIWHDLKKLNKLREIKKRLIDKYLKRGQSDTYAVTNEVTLTKNPVELSVEATPKINHNKIIGGEESFSDYSWFYKDIKSGNTNNNSDSEESFIKFSNEIPRQENNINFRIEDILKDVTKLLSKKLKKKTETKTTTQYQGLYFPMSSKETFINNEIDSKEKFRKELIEPQGQKSKPKKPTKWIELDSNELIHKHVAAILEEERKLDKLKKFNEINMLEQSA